VEEETESVNQYRRLAESADLHARDAAGLVTDPELSITLAWRDREVPNAAWAERYDAELDRALAFLEMSERARDEEVMQRRRARRRKRLIPIVATAAASIVAILAVFSVFAVSERNAAVTARDSSEALRQLAEKKQAAVTRQVKAQAAAQLEQGTLNGLLAQLRAGCKPKDTFPCPINVLKKEVDNARKATASLTRIAEVASAAAAAVSSGGGLIPIRGIRRTDLFDLSQGVHAIHSSGYSGRAMFGQTQGNPEIVGMLDDQVGETWVVTFFKDGKPAGYRHWVEWKTKDVVKLKSIGLFARHDDVQDGYKFRRAFKEFTLYAREGRGWVALVKYDPTLPYAGGRSGTSLAVCLPVPPTAAQRFKAVFVQATNILGQFSGPRVVGLDGNDATCADQYPEH
jgi:hypothetical protein